MKKSKILLGFLLSVFLLAGCATRKEVVQFKDDMKYLKKEVESLQNDNRDLKQMISELNRSLAALEEQNNQTRADLLAEMSGIRDQSRSLDNKLEDNMERISKYVQPPKPVQTVQFPPDSLPPSDSSKSGGSVADGSQLTLMPRQIYENAYKDLTRGNFELARQGFLQFLETFGNSNFADNAQYWLGETYYASGEYDTAIKEFEKVIENYPEEDKVSAAMLKIGFAYLRQGNTAEGRNYLNRVVQRFPYTEEGRLAQSRLSEIQ